MQDPNKPRNNEPGHNMPAQGFGGRYEMEHSDIHSDDIENAHAVGLGASGGRRMVDEREREDFTERDGDFVY